MDWHCASRNVRDEVWVMYRLHPCEVLGVEGVVAFFHELEEPCRTGRVLGPVNQERYFTNGINSHIK